MRSNNAYCYGDRVPHNAGRPVFFSPLPPGCPFDPGPSSALRMECMAQGRWAYPAEEADAGIGRVLANQQIPGVELCLIEIDAQL
jgi:hypothetical protein